jgi:hypothetical protein
MSQIHKLYLRSASPLPTIVETKKLLLCHLDKKTGEARLGVTLAGFFFQFPAYDAQSLIFKVCLVRLAA